MLDIRVLKKYNRRYPQEFREIRDKFLLEASNYVKTDASRRAPVDTGNLSNSINVTSISDGTATIGTNLEYAPHVEYGTIKMRAQPYMRPAIDENRQMLIRMLRDRVKEQFRGR